MNFRIFAATLSLARAIEAGKAAAAARTNLDRENLVVLVADRHGELALIHVSPESSIEQDARALNHRGLRALSYLAIPVAGMSLQEGLVNAIHALSHSQESSWKAFDEDPMTSAFIKRLIADSDPISLSDLSVDSEGSKWGLYVDPKRLVIAVHAIDEKRDDPARGILAFIMKARSSEQLTLTMRVIEDARALEEIRTKGRTSLGDFLGSLFGGAKVEVIQVDGFTGSASGRGARRNPEAAI